VESSPRLSAATSGFVLAAAATVVFNTALAWVKDGYKPVNDLLTTVSGHHWTTHGLADVVVFAVLGLIFTSTGAGEKIAANRLINILIASVGFSGLGLALWYVFF
jgi:hypothetical protein